MYVAPPRFKLPGPDDRCTELLEKNPVPREERIKFFEERARHFRAARVLTRKQLPLNIAPPPGQRQESHHYTVDGIRAPRSVTAIAHEYQPSTFNPQRAIESMRAGKKWAAEKREEFLRDDGRDMSDEEICSLWDFKGRVASARGTLSPGPLTACDGNCP